MEARYKHWLVVLFVVVLAFAIPFYLLAEAPKAASTLKVIYTGNTEVDIQYGFDGVDWDTHSARLTRNDEVIAQGRKPDFEGTHVLRSSGLAANSEVTFKLILTRHEEEADDVDIITLNASTRTGDVRGTILDDAQTRSTTWSGQTPFKLTGDVTIDAGASLTIESGTFVEVPGGLRTILGVGTFSATKTTFNDTSQNGDAVLHIVAGGNPTFSGNSGLLEMAVSFPSLTQSLTFEDNAIPNARIDAKGSAGMAFTFASSSFESLAVSKSDDGENLTGSMTIRNNTIQGDPLASSAPATVSVSDYSGATLLIQGNDGEFNLSIPFDDGASGKSGASSVVPRAARTRIVRNNQGVAEIVLTGSNIAVQNNTVTGSGPNAIGIWFKSGGNNLIENNQIALTGGGSTSITGVRIGNLSGTGDQATTTKNEILTNTITGFNIGVRLFPASETLIQDNTFSNIKNKGIWITAGHENRVRDNQISGGDVSTNEAGVGLGNLSGAGDQAATTKNEIVGNNITGFRTGISVFPATETLIQGNAIVDNRSHGIRVENSSRTTIGGTTAEQGNHIAGNDENGIFIVSVGAGNPTITTGNIIIGNMIGTDAAGATAQGNLGAGVWIKNASDIIVGGLTPGERNIISANRQSGVVIEGVDAQNNKVLGNFIGTDVTGQIIDPDGSVNGDELGNGLTAKVGPDAGISVIEGASKNIIGGDMNVGTVSKCEMSCNLVSGNREGIRIGGPSSPDPSAVGANQVLGNFIGSNVNGIAPLGNRFAGVAIFGSPDNIVGGTTAGSANLFSANGLAGVQISGASSTGNKIIGNNIGTNLEGNCTVDGVPNSCLLGNFVGLRIDDGASKNTVGGVVAGSRNIISGNTNAGIRINGTLFGAEPQITTDNVVVGNLIGLQRYNTRPDIDPWGNGGDGIYIGFGVRGNRVGGTTPAERNVISDNGRAGVRIEGSSADANFVLGNFIGTNATGSADLRFGNDGAGVVIDKGADNVIGAILAPASGKSGVLECRDGCNVISQNTQGIEIRGLEAKNNQIVGNFIGTDVSGTVDLGNQFSGVSISNAPSNRIGISSGETASSSPNLISGNGSSGVQISGAQATGNVVISNLIGTEKTGTASLGNGSFGVEISGAKNNRIGGVSKSGESNLISGNAFSGVSIQGSDASGNTVQANLIGTQLSDLSAPIPNGSSGVQIGGGASNNTIGGIKNDSDLVHPGNIIAFNKSHGVVVESGVNNRILGNTIHGNTFLGIDLGGNLVTPNDTDDVDEGANNLQNFPVITEVLLDTPSLGKTTIKGTLNSLAGRAYHIEFFLNEKCDNSGFGEGGILLEFVASVGSGIEVNGGLTGTVSFQHVVPIQLSDSFITLTATDLHETQGGTSEFSKCSGIDGITVNSVGDGPDSDLSNATCDTGNLVEDKPECTLRAAIQTANGLAGHDVIRFEIPGTGIPVIRPASSLPSVGESALIDGATQGDIVQIDGTSAGEFTNGLVLFAGNSTVKGLAISHFGGSGLQLTTGDGNLIQNNRIGTNGPGTAAQPNGNGILIFGSKNNTIKDNLISGNTGSGVLILDSGATDNRLLGNFIGTHVDGIHALGNQGSGVTIRNASNNTVGGDTSDARNVISANGGSGVELSSDGALGNRVLGNFIGVDKDGGCGSGSTVSCTLGNKVYGVAILTGAILNGIGGSGAGEGNVISANLNSGVGLNGAGVASNSVLGNFIGVDSKGACLVDTGGLCPFGNRVDGVSITFGAKNNTVGGFLTGEGNVISGNFNSGVFIALGDADGNRVIGNNIGTDASGAKAIGNRFNGVSISAGSKNNIIGGEDAGEGNVISGNFLPGLGMFETSGNKVQGNFIGTDGKGECTLGSDGKCPLGNRQGGIAMGFEANNNIIGGKETGQGNVISGNHLAGINLFDPSGTQSVSTGNQMLGNFIGTNKVGKAKIGNKLAGVRIHNSTGNAVGGEDTGSGNTIAFNGAAGALITSEDKAHTRNTILRNSIHSNTGIGIDLGGDGVTANDQGDTDKGANAFQNAPVTVDLLPASVTLKGILDSTIGDTFRIEAFSSSQCDETRFGEGENFLGSFEHKLTEDGIFQHAFTGVVVPEGHLITVTATNLNAQRGGTSEFSACFGEIIVNSTTDTQDNDQSDGLCNTGGSINGKPECTLRAAIQTANAIETKNTIRFAIPGAAGVPRIIIGGPLPTIIKPVVINGTTQQPQLQVHISTGSGNGLHITAGSSAVIGMLITKFEGHGILLEGGGQNLIQNNRIGTDASAAVGLGNAGDGIHIENSANNTIGGAAENRNIVGSNVGDGIEIKGASATGNVLRQYYRRWR